MNFFESVEVVHVLGHGLCILIVCPVVHDHIDLTAGQLIRFLTEGADDLWFIKQTILEILRKVQIKYVCF